MNDLSKTLPPATLPDLPSAISLQELAFGRLPYDVLGGQTIAQFGQCLAPASLSARQARELGLMTSGICGPMRSTSLRSAHLQLSLGSKLAQRLSNLGSTLYTLTWKPWVTPSGVLRFRQRASVRRTSETERTGWPTPTASLADKGVRSTEGGIREAMRKHGPDLGAVACLSGWTTPTTRDHKDSPGMVAQRDGRDRNDQLPRQAYLAGWPTVTANTNDQPETERGLENLGGAVKLSGWPTPMADCNRGASPEEALKDFRPSGHKVQKRLQDVAAISGPARRTVSGEILTGSSAGMESGGQLSPAHPRWLMGLPPEWDDCAPTETLSTLKQRRNLSSPT